LSDRAILIVGAGPLQVPLVHAARGLRLRTVVMDRNPRAPGLTLADSPHVADVCDPAAALHIARSERVTAVLSACTDYAVRTVAVVARELGLPGASVEAAERATDKYRMREAFARAGAPAPTAVRAASEKELGRAAEQLGYPVIVKPTDGVGSKGVTRVDAPGGLAVAWARGQAISRTGALVCEEFVEGPEVSVEGLTRGGRTHLVAITDKITSEAPFFVETGHTMVSRLPPDAQRSVLEVAHQGIEALGIDDSGTHTEIRLGPDGPRLMEIGARLGGDRITSDLVPLATGVDIFAGAVKVALGEDPDVRPRRQTGAAIRYFLPAPGTVVSIEGDEASKRVEGVVDWVLDVGMGGTVPPLENSLSRVGHVVTRADTPEEAAARAEQARSLLKVTTRP
jgi:biotin carboxylase